ncbi:HTH_Tnp_Tc3_2 domain-containing protein [Trichonephila clavipes]|nr:HTH_Tnp_Tc3_2 domain-containing protein [Trichonephila clavipes]
MTSSNALNTCCKLTEFKRGRVIRLQEGGFSFRDIATVHDFWKQGSRDGTASRRPGSGRPHDTTEREDRHIQFKVVAHHTESLAEIRAAIGTTATQKTVRNRLLQGQLRIGLPVASILLTPIHCRLRHQCCQARVHWRTEWIYVVFSDDSNSALVPVIAECW